MVAIGGTLYYHNKYLVARGDLSITTLNIVVAIGETLCCHTKFLVAIGETLCCHTKFLVAILPRHFCVAIAYIATSNDYTNILASNNIGTPLIF
jgi:hypothetical protein